MLQDFLYALKTLRRSPGYAVLCVAVLALGIGANVAIFSVLNAVVLQALPYPAPERLVFVWQRFPSMPPPVGPRMMVSRASFEEWQKQNTVFSEMAAYRGNTLEETGAAGGRKLETGFASAGMFPMLGATARVGRLFTKAEERAGNDRVVVLTDRYFERRFHGDRSALGKQLTLNHVSYTVIGVLPPRFHVPSTYEGSDQVKAEVWVPLSRLWNNAADDKIQQLLVPARLKPGVSLERARSEMQAIAKRLEQANSDLKGWTTSVFSFATEETGPELHVAIYVLMAAVGFLLLIGCANLANLTLARATTRSREIAVRLALGASRARIVAQLATEAFVVSAAGAALGLVLAQWCINLLLAFHPEDIQRPEAIRLDGTVFAFAALASVVTTLLFGLVPSLSASKQDLNTALKAGGSKGGTAARLRTRQFLIALEVGLALTLLVGAGLMIRSFQELLAVGVGFRTEQVTIADIELPADRYRDPASRSRFFADLLARVRSGPGIAEAAVVDNPPLHKISMANFFIAGRPDPDINALPIADMAHASPGYFSLIGLRLERGRWFTDADRAFTEKGGDSVAIVNRAFAKQFFPNENPLGHRLQGGDRKTAAEIIGVVSDFRPMGVENGTRPTIFWPDLRLSTATLMVRSAIAAQPLADYLRGTIRLLDANLQPSELQPMGHYIDQWLSQRKFNTSLLGLFAGLALVLGMLGIYGVISNLVASRVREIGIRMAIGATPAAIGRLVMRQSLTPVVVD